jgi:hypothetical protein
MRKTATFLGFTGGLAGIGAHVYLLVGLLEQGGPASEEVKRLAVGIVLGIIGAIAALAMRASRPASVTLMFSMAALGLFPNPTSWAPAAALLLLASLLVLTGGRRTTWDRGGKTLVFVSVVLAAAVVIPFSLWPQESMALASELTSKSPTAVATNGTSTSVASVDTTTGVNAASPYGSVLYSDTRFGLTLSVPSGWAKVPGGSVADFRPKTYHIASFAEITGPTLNGAYLNGLNVKLLARSLNEDPPKELMRDSVQAFIDGGPEEYDYFMLLEPIRDSSVGGVPALAATARITWNERVLVKSVYTVMAGNCVYRIDVMTDDVYWDAYQDLFEQMLDSFAFAGSATTH